MRARAQVALAQGAYEEAILLLQQLIRWFGDSKDPQTVLEMRSAYFNLGLCHFLLGHFSESESAFQTFVRKYKSSPKAVDASVYIADGYRYLGQYAKAVGEYKKVLARYGNSLSVSWRADINASMARCALAEDDWAAAIPFLEEVHRTAPDSFRSNWAASLLTIAYLKEMQLEKVYRLVPYLLQDNSLASRSVGFNMAALEAGDILFADERYRDALWIYRLVYSHEMLSQRSRAYLERLESQVKSLQSTRGLYHELLRTRETIGELERDLEVLESIESYDTELWFRIARSYMEVRRYREARHLFLYLYEMSDGDVREESLYLAFLCSTSVRPWDKAFEQGLQYMREFAAGRFYDRVSLRIGQMYAQLQDWPNTIAILKKALQVRPQHESATECMFLIGYASFMEEEFEEAVTWLTKMNTDYPGNDRAEDGTYWTAMAYLFDTRYEEGYTAFDRFLSAYPSSTYAEDATFRRAVCDYGLSRYQPAEEALEAFLQTYPESMLTGEAYMMLGDISGVFGDARKAVPRLQTAMQHELNIELYNYCAFRAAEVLNDLNDFAGIISHFETYLADGREGYNAPQAIYWTGRAMWQMDKKEAALAYFADSVEKYGAQRDALGIDMILEDLAGKSKGVSERGMEDAWERLRNMMVDARTTGKRALALRLERILLFKPGLPDSEKRAIMNRLVRAENLADASPSVLELIADEARKRNMHELAVRAAETMIEDFTETDYALSARMMLADYLASMKEYDRAMEHLNVVREVFASDPEAARALLMLGNLYLQRGKFEEADKCFTEILGVKEWRGPLFPAALYGRGEAYRRQGKYDKATAYYERIYLMYSHYAQWAAKAYLRRANCLVRLHQKQKARETLEELLANPELAKTEEAQEATKLLESL